MSVVHQDTSWDTCVCRIGSDTWNIHEAISGRTPTNTHCPSLPHRSVEQYPQAEQIPGLLLVRLDAPIYFANVQAFQVGRVGETGPTMYVMHHTAAFTGVSPAAPCSHPCSQPPLPPTFPPECSMLHMGLLPALAVRFL